MLSHTWFKEQLQASPDSVARIAYFMRVKGLCDAAEIARKLGVSADEVPDLIALGTNLVSARRR